MIISHPFYVISMKWYDVHFIELKWHFMRCSVTVSPSQQQKPINAIYPAAVHLFRARVSSTPWHHVLLQPIKQSVIFSFPYWSSILASLSRVLSIWRLYSFQIPHAQPILSPWINDTHNVTFTFLFATQLRVFMFLTLTLRIPEASCSYLCWDTRCSYWDLSFSSIRLGKCWEGELK